MNKYSVQTLYTVNYNDRGKGIDRTKKFLHLNLAGVACMIEVAESGDRDLEVVDELTGEIVFYHMWKPDTVDISALSKSMNIKESYYSKDFFAEIYEYYRYLIKQD